MNGFYTFDGKANLLSSAVWLARTVQAEFTLTGVKAEEAVRRKRLFFVGLQSDNVSIKCSNTFHVFDKEYDVSYIHEIAPNDVTTLVGV